jgi:hypothetical protein
MRLLRRERHGARSPERLREPRQHRKVGVKPDTFKATDAERCEPVVMVETPAPTSRRQRARP